MGYAAKGAIWVSGHRLALFPLDCYTRTLARKVRRKTQRELSRVFYRNIGRQDLYNRLGHAHWETILLPNECDNWIAVYDDDDIDLKARQCAHDGDLPDGEKLFGRQDPQPFFDLVNQIEETDAAGLWHELLRLVRKHVFNIQIEVPWFLRFSERIHSETRKFVIPYSQGGILVWDGTWHGPDSHDTDELSRWELYGIPLI